MRIRTVAGVSVVAMVVAVQPVYGADLGTVVTKVDGLSSNLTASNTQLDKAKGALFSMVASKEQKDKIDRDTAALKDVQDPKEKQAKLAAIEKEKADVVDQATADKEAEKHQLTEDQKKQLPKVLFNLVWVGLQDTKLAGDAKALLPEAKDALKSASEKKSGGGLMGALSGAKKGADDVKRGQQAVNEDLPRIAEEAPKQAQLAGAIASGVKRLLAANKVPEGAPPTVTSKPADL